MVHQQLIDYIKQQLQQGVSKDQIRNLLIEQGWQTEQLDEAFSFFEVDSSSHIVDKTSSSTEIAPQEKKGFLGFFLTILFVVLIIGGGVLSYFYFFPSPEKILQEMISHLPSVKSLEYSGEIKVSTDTQSLLENGASALPIQLDSTKKTSSLTLGFEGMVDVNDSPPKGMFSLHISTDALASQTLSIDIETRLVKKVIYVMLKEIPDLGFFDVSFLKNKWVRIDTTEAQDKLGLTSNDSSSKPSSEQMRQIRTALEKANIMQVIQKLPSETLDGMDTYHYKFILNKEALRDFALEVQQIVNKTIDPTKLNNVKDANLSGEIWIGKQDFLPHKISFDSVMEKNDTSNVSGKVEIVFSFKNFNSPIRVDAPDETKSIEEILQSLFSPIEKTNTEIIVPPTQVTPTKKPKISIKTKANASVSQ